MEIWRNFTAHIDHALSKASLSKDDIKFVELIGGGSRVPRITNLVKEYFAPAEVGAHMNGD